jgi:hypothetical protein
MTRRLIALLVLSVVLVLLVGCSMPRFFWSFADRVAMSRVDDWLALEGEQRELALARIDAWLEEDLRREFMPRYADFLHELADTAETGLDPVRVEDLFVEADALYAETARSIVPHAAAILANLDGSQQDHLAERLAQANEEYEEDYLFDDEEARREALGDRFIQQVERWSGTLEPEQRRIIHEHAARLPDTAGEWYRYRRYMEAELLGLLADDVGEAAVAEHLECWWVERCGRTREERVRTDKLRDGLMAMIAELDVWLTSEQQQRALSQLRRRAGQLEDIAAP